MIYGWAGLVDGIMERMRREMEARMGMWGGIPKRSTDQRVTGDFRTYALVRGALATRRAPPPTGPWPRALSSG